MKFAYSYLKKIGVERIYVFTGSILLLILVFLECIWGSVHIPFHTLARIVMEGPTDHSDIGMQHSIVWDIRIPRLLTAILAGIALSLSGLSLQTLFRNPLAGPFVLGVSSGAGMGVALLIFGVQFFPSISYFMNSIGIMGAAWLGSGILMLLTLLLSFRLDQSHSLLLVGIMSSSVISALISVLHYFSGASEIQRYALWTMGSLSGLTYEELFFLGAAISIGMVWMYTLSPVLNALLLGEEYVKLIGISSKSLRIQLVILSCILAGSITAFCGPLAFIGLAAPHMSRLLLRSSDHRKLFPFIILLSSILMLFCDLVSQVPGYQIILPINVVTSILGGPIVILLLIKKG